ncbi:MAG: hypothetical protein JKP92_03205 [Alphaproteobacteria bacterium]|jgi:amino acid permease|nr:hypothetical protein [Alphaproteobacteria bacterium]
MLLATLLRRKPIEPTRHTPLRRCLGAVDLTLLGIGAIIGTGIFVLTGVAAATQPGPWAGGLVNLPAAGIILVLMALLLATHGRFLAWLALGAALYFAYGWRHSVWAQR